MSNIQNITNTCCIYRHLKPNGEVFYIGIAVKPKRPYSKANRNKYWHNVVNKYGYEVDVLKIDLTWEEAKELEIDLISFYGRKDLGLGTLVNLTDGGEGTKQLSQEAKDKISEVNGLKISSEELIELFINQNMSYKEIALYYNCHIDTIKKKLRKYDIKKSKNLITEVLRRNYKPTPNHPIYKKVINTITNEEYNSIKQCALINGFKTTTLRNRLYNIYFNDTNFKLL